VKRNYARDTIPSRKQGLDLALSRRDM
jgi:hypothetical protein